MRFPIKKTLSLLLVLTLLCSIAFEIGAPVNAATYRTGANGASSSYKGGKYYANYQRVTLTGDGVTDVLAIALSQTGYEEGNSSSAMSGTAGGSSNYTEFCYNMGDWGAGYGGSDYPWCATFVSWALYQARCTDQMGASDWCRKHTGDSSYIWCEVSCSQWANQLRRYNRFKYSAQNGGTYKPQPGDLIFFDWEGGSSGEDHIGIVVYSDSSKVYTIEGNTSDAQGLEDNGGGTYFKSYSLSYDYISGYGVLPYKDVASVPTIDYSGAKPTPGLYMATSSSKYVYTTETGSTYNNTMPRFTMFEVTDICSNGRLKVKYTSGSTTITGYILNNTDRVVQISSTQVDGLDKAVANADAIYFGDYSENVLSLIRAKYATAKSLLASSTSTYQQKKTCADELNALIARKGEGTLVSEGCYVTAFNKKVVAADCNIFTPSFGTITADKANHKWTTNIIAKYDTDEAAYIIKSIDLCPGNNVTDVTIASDEILIAVHQDTTNSACNSLKNGKYIGGAKVGDVLTFVGADPKAGTITCGAYFTYETRSIPGDANGDKIISSTDYIQVKSHCNSTVLLKGDAVKRADFNGDGVISSADFIAIRKACAGN